MVRNLDEVMISEEHDNLLVSTGEDNVNLACT
jgi:hypothetical protein